MNLVAIVSLVLLLIFLGYMYYDVNGDTPMKEENGEVELDQFLTLNISDDDIVPTTEEKLTQCRTCGVFNTKWSDFCRNCANELPNVVDYDPENPDDSIRLPA